MMMQPFDSSAAEFVDQVQSLVTDRRLDGLVLTPPIADHEKLLARLRELGTPFASVAPRNQSGAGVFLDERQAACDMVKYLASLGHERIGHVIGHPGHGAAQWRLQGYRAGLEQCGLRYVANLVIPGTFLFDSGVAAARKLLALKIPPTAVFAANDDMAAGVMWAANELGLSIPRDLSVCGFDDTPMSRQIWPSLTTVHQPCQDMGRIAASQLFRVVRGGPGELVHADYSLCLRGSTAALAG
jgi:LacI family transcriptional regulator